MLVASSFPTMILPSTSSSSKLLTLTLLPSASAPATIYLRHSISTSMPFSHPTTILGTFQSTTAHANFNPTCHSANMVGSSTIALGK
ncbi:hypothetical protein BCR44DRAFT_1430473 [Catenaria anguillulae PL171]|uniref:Uncharacterized protein n=1 Tax=Catenaria anguillulae PL171 TaxID=765915 RepID=A0A1Y2HSK2_9FUNG|nr:hypothetical protein BCR44DRAFT_1430473 [Catenaria anguillulae PL171]